MLPDGSVGACTTFCFYEIEGTKMENQKINFRDANWYAINASLASTSLPYGEFTRDWRKITDGALLDRRRALWGYGVSPYSAVKFDVEDGDLAGDVFAYSEYRDTRLSLPQQIAVDSLMYFESHLLTGELGVGKTYVGSAWAEMQRHEGDKLVVVAPSHTETGDGGWNATVQNFGWKPENYTFIAVEKALRLKHDALKELFDGAIIVIDEWHLLDLTYKKNSSNLRLALAAKLYGKNFLGMTGTLITDFQKEFVAQSYFFREYSKFVDDYDKSICAPMYAFDDNGIVVKVDETEQVAKTKEKYVQGTFNVGTPDDIMDSVSVPLSQAMHKYDVIRLDDNSIIDNNDYASLSFDEGFTVHDTMQTVQLSKKHQQYYDFIFYAQRESGRKFGEEAKRLLNEVELVDAVENGKSISYRKGNRTVTLGFSDDKLKLKIEQNSRVKAIIEDLKALSEEDRNKSVVIIPNGSSAQWLAMVEKLGWKAQAFSQYSNAVNECDDLVLYEERAGLTGVDIYKQRIFWGIQIGASDEFTQGSKRIMRANSPYDEFYVYGYFYDTDNSQKLMKQIEEFYVDNARMNRQDEVKFAYTD
jgi:hypothetical protein